MIRWPVITGIGDLIDRITLVFGKERGELTVVIEGRLARILTLAHGDDHYRQSMGMLVAGADSPSTVRLWWRG